MKTVRRMEHVGIVGLVMVLSAVTMAHAEWAQVGRVIDGDTFALTDGTRVRVKGIDTPETKHPRIAPEPGGEQATQFAQTVLQGQTVWLNGNSTDKYRRRLADVWTGGGLSYAEMVRQRGYDKQSRSLGLAFPGAAITHYTSSYAPAPTAFSSTAADSRGGTVFVRGYTRSDGTYVQPYSRSAPRR